MKKLLISIILLPLILHAQSPTQGVPINSLPAATLPLTGGETLPCVQLSITKKCLVSSISSFSLILPHNDIFLGNGSNIASASTISAALDTVFGSAQGDILYRGVSGWVVLTPGTNGLFLKTQGAGANPLWATPSFSLTVGTTVISSGANGSIEYNNSGVLGEKSTTGSGSVVLSVSPTITGSFTATGLITNSDLTNPATTVNGQTCTLGSSCTATVPISTGVSGLGTGVATALAINVGAAGSTILNAGALGTPSSGTLTNVTGLPAAGTVGTAGTLTVPDQILSGGANLISFSIGTVSSGTSTIDCGKNPAQFLTNGGSFTFAAPANDGTCLVMIINNGSAGTVTFSGFTPETSHGDALDTTNTHKFTISVWRINGTSDYRVAAMQ